MTVVTTTINITIRKEKGESPSDTGQGADMAYVLCHWELEGSRFAKGSWAGLEWLGAPGSRGWSLRDGLAGTADASGAGWVVCMVFSRDLRGGQGVPGSLCEGLQGWCSSSPTCWWEEVTVLTRSPNLSQTRLLPFHPEQALRKEVGSGSSAPCFSSCHTSHSVLHWIMPA